MHSGARISIIGVGIGIGISDCRTILPSSTTSSGQSSPAPWWPGGLVAWGLIPRDGELRTAKDYEPMFSDQTILSIYYSPLLLLHDSTSSLLRV